jgi:hypothetical protein
MECLKSKLGGLKFNEVCFFGLGVLGEHACQWKYKQRPVDGKEGIFCLVECSDFIVNLGVFETDLVFIEDFTSKVPHGECIGP